MRIGRGGIWRQAASQSQTIPVSLKAGKEPATITGIDTKPADNRVMARELLPSLAYLEAQLKKEIESAKCG